MMLGKVEISVKILKKEVKGMTIYIMKNIFFFSLEFKYLNENKITINKPINWNIWPILKVFRIIPIKFKFSPNPINLKWSQSNLGKNDLFSKINNGAPIW